jgi:cysteine-rich repeat protein
MDVSPSVFKLYSILITLRVMIAAYALKEKRKAVKQFLKEFVQNGFIFFLCSLFFIVQTILPLPVRAQTPPEQIIQSATQISQSSTNDVIKLPSPITLARSQSAFSVDTAENGQLTINYTVINTRNEEVGEILLATTLETGVSLSSADPIPDQNDQTLAFVLPSIPPFGEVTATLTVDLPAGPGPITVDYGARAFGNLRTRAVDASVEPTILRDTIGVSGDYLASTIDAHTSDRYVLQKTGEIGCDPVALFEYVRDEIGYEVYRGSLRGARGTLWSSAGNALDQASLLVALLRACGVPSRYVSGNLDEPPAQELILSMFEPLSRVVGGLDPADLPDIGDVDINEFLLNATQYLPGADEISDPANDPELLEEAQQHFWVEYYDGAGFVAMDPAFEVAQVGDTFTSLDSTFAEVDDAIRHKVQIRLDTEMLALGATQGFFQVAEGFDEIFQNEDTNLKRIGSIVVQENSVLDQTLRTVELVGEPISIGHFLDQLVIPGIVTTTFNTYSPWLQVGDRDELIRGDDYEEIISTVGSNIVAGVFLRMTVIDSQGNGEDFEHAWVDRLGFALRQGEANQSTEISPDPSELPAPSPGDTITVNVLSSLQVSGLPERERHRAALVTTELERLLDEAQVAESNPTLSRLVQESLVALQRVRLADLSLGSGSAISSLERHVLVKAYHSSPALFVSGDRFRGSGEALEAVQFVDLVKPDVRVLTTPSSRNVSETLFRTAYGTLLTGLEGSVFSETNVPGENRVVTALAVLNAAGGQGIEMLWLSPDEIGKLDSLNITEEARARIRNAMAKDRSILVPLQAALIDGVPRIAWLELSTNGDLIGVLENGGHASALEKALFINFIVVPVFFFIGEYVVRQGKGNAIDKAVASCLYYRSVEKWCGIIETRTSFWLFEKGYEHIAIEYGFQGYLVCGSGMLLVAAGRYIIDQGVGNPGGCEDVGRRFGDPPLDVCRIDPLAAELPARSSAESISVQAVLTPDVGLIDDVSTQAGFYRLEGELQGAFIGGTPPARFAFYPSALSGIAASGGVSSGGANFESTLDVDAVPPQGATANFDLVEGSITINGQVRSSPLSVGFTGFTGSIGAADSNLTDTLELTNGTFDRVLSFTVDPQQYVATQNDSVVLTPIIESNADDTYTLTAEAPYKWNVEMAEDGMTTITPAHGLISGTYEVRFHAQSETDPDLRSEATVWITVVPPDIPEIDVRIVPDTLFNVSHQSTLIKTAYRIEIQNLSTTGDTFDVSVSGLDSEDFTLAAESVVVGPGETGIVGVAIHPSAGLLPAGTDRSFSATATGRDTGLTDTDTINFTYPEVVGVLPSFNPSLISTTPGSTVNAALSLVSNGNVDEEFTLIVQSYNGIVVSGVPTSATLSPVQILTLPVTVDIPQDASVGTIEGITVTADLCNGEPPESCIIPLPSQRYANLALLIGTPEAECVLDSAVVAADTDLGETAAILQDVGNALSRLATDPGNVLLQSRTITAGNALLDFFYNSELIDKGNNFRDLLLEIESGDVSRIEAALGQVCTVLDGLSVDLTNIADRIAHGFRIRLTPSGQIVAPDESAVFNVRLESTGSETSTINLSLEGLPVDVSSQLSQSTVILSTGQVIDASSSNPIVLTLSSPNVQRPSVGFTLNGQVEENPSVTGSASGSLAVLESAVDVLAVTPSPRAVENAGETVSVNAELMNRANVLRTVQVSMRVEDAVGTTVFTGTPVTTELNMENQTTSVDLGPIDTTGFATGAFTVIVQVQNETGITLPGREGRGVFLIGFPLVASVTAEPSEVPPGSLEQVLSKVTVGSRELSEPGTGFYDQYAKAVSSATDATAPEEALGPPDHSQAIIEIGGSLVLDMGSGLDRLSDGSGPDIVVFQADLDGQYVAAECFWTRDAEYQVEVAEDIGGPYYLLGTNDSSVDDRKPGDEFDLLSAGINSARFVRITPITESVAIDAVLAIHTHQPGGIRIEHFVPTPCSNCFPCAPGSIFCFPATGIINSPAVGDLTGDGAPEIVVTAATKLQQHETLVINGVTMEEEFRVTLPEGGGSNWRVGNSASPALGDLDGDGMAEIVIHSEHAGHLVAVRADGTEIFNVSAGNGLEVSPALENVDHDPYPEILWPEGYLESDGTPGLVIKELPNESYYTHYQPVTADLDGDGIMELVMTSNKGNLTARESDGTIIWTTADNLLHGSYAWGGRSVRPAVADLDSDGRPDFVVLGGNWPPERRITVINADGELLWQKILPNPGGRCTITPQLCSVDSDCPAGETCKTTLSLAASRPAIADLNGDGDQEIVLFLWIVPDDQHDYVIAMDKNGNELWRTEAQDPGGSPPSIATADLNGDGAAEVLWNGSCSGFTILDGTTGAVLYRNPLVRSASAHDYPVAADVDADGHLEVLTGSMDGLYVFGNDNGWSSGRKVWNQSDYRITNVNDDLSIPVTQPESWRFHNTYLFQGALPQEMAEASLEVDHQLGPQVLFQPGEIDPAPAQVNESQILWTDTFPTIYGRSYSVPVQAPALQPGESVVVSEITLVDGTLTLLDGQVIDVSIPVGPVSVYAPHIIDIEPSTNTVSAGDTGDFTVNMRNLRDLSETFTLEVVGIDPASVSIASSVVLLPGEVTSIPLNISTSQDYPGGIIDFIVSATGDQGTIDEAGARLEVTENPISHVDGGGVHVRLLPETTTVGQGAFTVVQVVVTNTGNETQTFDLSSTLPSGITGSFQDTFLEVAPGITASQETVLTLSVDPGTPPGDQIYTVYATSRSDSTITYSAEGMLTVSHLGVHIELTPEIALVIPGQNPVFEAAVTNTGMETEIFNLSIGGPFGAFACMTSSPPCPETISMTLGPGESQTVEVTLSGLNPFLQQRTMLVAQAVSVTDPQVLATDASVLDIGAFRDVSAEFDPIEISSSSLDPVEYLLKIRNEGNACDERYTMVFSSDPPGVVLTPETTQFLVPPQKTAGIRVSAQSQDYGTFTIQAHVTAQTDNPLCPALGTAEDMAEATLILEPVNVCGDGILEDNEECDDGNTLNGDCCSSTCLIDLDGSVCDDANECTTGDTCTAGVCSGTPPGDCPTVLTTSGPCDVNEDGLIDSHDDFAIPLNAEDEGNVCQELNALGGFVITLVNPVEFSSMTVSELASYDCIVLDTKPHNITGLGMTWQNVIGIESGGGVFLTNHDALWHSYFNRVLAPPGFPDDRYGPQTLIRDAVIWLCSNSGLVLFNIASDFVPGSGFTAFDSLPQEWGIVEDYVDTNSNAVGTDILPAFEIHPIYMNVTDLQDPPCDDSGSPMSSTIPNSMCSFPSFEYFSCTLPYSDHSYHQLFREFNADIFIQSEQAFSKTNDCEQLPDGADSCDPFPDVFPDGDPIDGSAISLIREEYRYNEILAPGDPIPVQTPVEVSAYMGDCSITSVQMATWDWGDDSTSDGDVLDLGRSWSIEGGHEYSDAGVYVLTLTLTDEAGKTCATSYHYIVVYDPDGGFVTGGGWIISPEGAYTADPLLTGKAAFGFVSKYKKGASIPTGSTEFQFKAADLNFHSNSYEWLVIAGAKAQYKGVGTVNGSGEYNFILSAIDADINNKDSFEVDRFRIRIWTEDELGNESVVYDNGLGDDGDEAITEIGGGSIVIHKR